MTKYDADLVVRARGLAKQAWTGDAVARREVLAQATVALCDVIAGRLPDAERMECLRFLAATLFHELGLPLPESPALASLAVDFPNPPAKARGRRKSVGEGRNTRLFIEVGLAYQQELKRGTYKPVEAAIEKVGGRYKGFGRETVKKAWDQNGGLANWKREWENVGSDYKPHSEVLRQLQPLRHRRHSKGK